MNSGVDPMMIAVIWGTHPLDMLLKRYGHFMDQTRREAILKFDRKRKRMNAKWYTNPKMGFKKSYKSLKNKSGDGTRTRDTHLGKQTLY